MRKPKLFDKVANFFGYVKQVALSSSAVFGIPESPNPKTKNYLNAYAGWVYACVKARATDVSRIELNLFKVKDRKTGEVEKIAEHDILSVLRSVNEFMTFRELIKGTQSYKDLAGEAFWWLVKSGKTGDENRKILQIWPLRPDWMTVITDNKAFIKGYRYEVPGNEPVLFDIDEIIHFKEFNPVNAYRGLSIVRAAAWTIDTDDFAEKYNRNFFKNSAIPPTVLSTEQKLQPAQIDRMRAEWRKEYQGPSKYGKMAILEGGLELKAFSISQKDMEFLSGQGFTRDKIFALFQTPKTVLGMTENVTVSNAEATDLIFSKRVVKPAMEDIRDTLNEFLLPQFKDGDDLFFEITDPVPQDEEAKSKKNESLFKTGSITQNEIRSREGLDEVEGLDRFYLPLKLQPISTDGSETEKGKSITHKNYKEIKVNIPPDRIKQKLINDLKKNVTKQILSRVLKLKGVEFKKEKKEEPELQPSKLSDDVKEAFWKQLVGKSEHIEDEYLRKIRQFFKDQRKRVLNRLEGKKAVKISKNDIEDIIISVPAENKIAAEITVPILSQMVEEAGNDALDLVGFEDLAFDMTTPAVRQYITDGSLKGIKATNRVTKKKLRAVLSQGIDDGLSIPQLAKEIDAVYEEANKVRSLRIARTEVSKAVNTGTLEGYKQSGVVAGKEWFTALDERVCQWCDPMHGKIKSNDINFFQQGETFLGKEGGTLNFQLDDVGAPPLHPNCRCVLIPITISGERSVNKPVIKDSKYDDYDKHKMKEEITEEVTKKVTKEVIEALDEI